MTPATTSTPADKERDLDIYRTPDERFEGLPAYDFDPHYTEQDELRMHYVDEGSGSRS